MNNLRNSDNRKEFKMKQMLSQRWNSRKLNNIVEIDLMDPWSGVAPQPGF